MESQGPCHPGLLGTDGPKASEMGQQRPASQDVMSELPMLELKGTLEELGTLERLWVVPGDSLFSQKCALWIGCKPTALWARVSSRSPPAGHYPTSRAAAATGTLDLRLSCPGPEDGLREEVACPGCESSSSASWGHGTVHLILGLL